MLILYKNPKGYVRTPTCTWVQVFIVAVDASYVCLFLLLLKGEYVKIADTEGDNMLILPIINKNRIMNVELRIKDASKIKRNVRYEDMNESEIIVNKEKFTESIFATSKENKAPIDFIRSKSILYPRNFLITTKKQEKNNYDIYELTQPPKKVSDGFDELYSKAITDLRKEIPGKQNRGRYVSLEDLGIDKDITDDKISTLQKTIKGRRENDDFGTQLKEAGVLDLQEKIEFFNHFECKILSDSIIPEESLQETLTALSSINTRDFRNLNKYYNMAKSNTDVFMKISYVNKMLYDKPLTIVHSSSKQKQLVKKKEETDYAKVA